MKRQIVGGRGMQSRQKRIIEHQRRKIKDLTVLENLVDHWIDDGMREQLLDKLDVMRVNHRDRLTGLPGMNESLDLIDEALSGDDWSRWGTIVALVWAKLDRLIFLLDGENKNTRDISQQLRQISSQINQLIAKIK